jgi:hypothetical protein
MGLFSFNDENQIKRPMTPYMKGDKSKQFVPLNNEKDKVYTPEETAIKIINKIDELYNLQGIILDPCKGPGAFYNNFPDKCQKDYCEIDEGIDFFKYNKKVDWCVSNPPYSIFNEFLTHSMEICDNIVYLIPINKLTSSGSRVGRLANWGGIPLIFILSNRDCNFPFGFAIGAVYFKKGYTGDIKVIVDDKLKQEGNTW